MASIALPVRVVPRLRLTWIIPLLLVIGGLLTLLFAAWRSIRPGYVGIVFDKVTHQVTTGALEPGWAFINPITQAIQEYPVTIQTYSMVQRSNEGSTEGNDSIKIQSNEGQQINLDVVIQYQVIKQEAGQLYLDWGGADITTVEDRVVRQYTRSQVPTFTSQYGWEEIVSSKRETINQQISAALEREFKKRHIQLISFAVREVHLPVALQAALDAKIQAQQAAEQQRYQLQQAEVKARQDETEAIGRANAARAEAAGDAEATLERARAQAEANRALAASLTDELLRYAQIQRWDGKLPVISGSNATPLIDANSLLERR